MEKKKLLIADSAEEFYMALESTLSQEFQVKYASNGGETLSLLENFEPDVLILDVMLPEVDGVTILQSPQRQKVDPKVIAVTPWSSPYLYRQLERLQVSYILTKPCRTDAVAERVRDIAQETAIQALPEPGCPVRDALLEMGFVVKHSGYRYLRSAAKCIAERPGQALSKELYVAVGATCGATAAQVERAIRYAVDVAWKRGDPQVWQRWFPNRKPTNGEIIAALAELLQQDRVNRKVCG